MTNEEIQIGEYVRTNNLRGIRKIARINEEATVNRYLFIDGYDHSDTIYGIIRADQITNHDFNIIKLIEVGDYVNGERVIEVGETRLGHYKYIADSLDRQIFEENISTIVTKEQFKSMEYKVGGEDDKC